MFSKAKSSTPANYFMEAIPGSYIPVHGLVCIKLIIMYTQYLIAIKIKDNYMYV